MRHFILTLATVTAAFAAAPNEKSVPPGGKPPPASPLEDKGRPVAKEPSLTPEETAKAFKLPPGFKVQVVTGEPDIVQPIAYTQDDRGRLWVVTNTNYPKCPGEPKDSIIIFEDTDGDGRADKRTVFYDRLTFSSGIAVGHGGVWVGAPPNLLFFPVKNGEDKPAGEPQVLLDGWGNEDTHETLNDFMWGPDGWLYGTHGVFTLSNVGKPGAPKNERTVINAAVWRYHPVKKIFERWAEGGSNQWGLDWNDHGEAFFAACVIPHMWHAFQGARYARQGGQHADANTYDDIKTIAWGRYEKAAYCGMMVYLGDLFPKEWRDTLFFHDIHMNKQRNERTVRAGSGYRTERNGDFIDSGDKWFRGLSPQYGPDGSVFINDWYDKVPCHQQREFTDRTNGRIYKVTTDSVKPVQVDLSKASEAELVQYQLHANDWYVRHARRILQERGLKPEGTAALEKILFENADDTRQLRALWALHCGGTLTDATALRALKAESEWVRGWAVTLMCELMQGEATLITVSSANPPIPPAFLGELARMAKDDKSPHVRLRIASAAQRIPVQWRWPVLTALASHAEDAGDQNLPLMLWYAAEPAVAADTAKAAELLASCQIPKVQEFITRRMAAQ
jgi:putative membrane-bound dehydrogenase-like protein